MNTRVMKFDENGKYLDEWDHIRSPYHMMITQDQHLWVSDGVTSQMVEYGLRGRQQKFHPKMGWTRLCWSDSHCVHPAAVAAAWESIYTSGFSKA